MNIFFQFHIRGGGVAGGGRGCYAGGMVWKRLRKLAGLVVLAGALALICGGCPKRAAPAGGVPAVSDAAGLMALLRSRTAGVERMDANVEIRLAGSEESYRGRFFGTLLMERRGPESLAVWLQVYSLIGAPVLEVVTEGDRVEVYSPLSRTVLFNFTELMGEEPREDFPLSSFGEVALPLMLIRDQIGLLWGLGFGEGSYELSAAEGGYALSEWSGGELSRRITYSRDGLDLLRARVFRGGQAEGGMDCGGYGGGGKASLFPERIEFYEGGSRVTLTLSSPRFDGDASGPGVNFRMPAHERLILLTPPVP